MYKRTTISCLLMFLLVAQAFPALLSSDQQVVIPNGDPISQQGHWTPCESKEPHMGPCREMLTPAQNSTTQDQHGGTLAPEASGKMTTPGFHPTTADAEKVPGKP